MTERIEKILAFATKAHGTQTRKGTGEPYINHPKRVAETVAKKRNNDIIIAAALLHDVLEDCQHVTEGILFDEVRACGFSFAETMVIVNTVGVLSRPDKTVPVLDYLDNIRGDFNARMVKLADLEDNMSDLSPGNLLDKYHLCKYYIEK